MSQNTESTEFFFAEKSYVCEIVNVHKAYIQFPVVLLLSKKVFPSPSPPSKNNYFKNLCNLQDYRKLEIIVTGKVTGRQTI